MSGKSRTPHRKLWLAWMLVTGGLISWFGFTMIRGEDKTVFMPGPLSPGHHQLEQACNACHTEALGGGEVLQQACVDCHGEDRKKPFDSHPRSKFTDPRNADRLEKIDALSCTTCHTEHRPEITLKDGLTQPVDLCFHCHSDIGNDRPSHEGMAFNTCKDSGCHNFHNNRALYTDFLVKHLHEPPLLDEKRVPEREFRDVLEEIVEYPGDEYPVTPLTATDIDAPESAQGDHEITGNWLASTHARSGVNCSACHQPAFKDNGEQPWNDRPDYSACATCHNTEVARFQKGKHGMRLSVGLPHMTAGDAKLPMKTDAADVALTCSTCHKPHQYNVREAAVDACLGCHDDRHSRAYTDSPHFDLWKQELAGTLPAGSGVSCATCHMSRVNMDISEWSSRIVVDHNQSASLSPNSKMIRPACLHCHGLEFSIDALADQELIAGNFKGKPAVHVRGMELAERDHRRAERERATAVEE